MEFVHGEGPEIQGHHVQRVGVLAGVGQAHVPVLADPTVAAAVRTGRSLASAT